MQYEKTPEEIMSEILAGANGGGQSDAEVAVGFLDKWSTWLASVINLVKGFFEKLGIKF